MFRQTISQAAKEAVQVYFRPIVKYKFEIFYIIVLLFIGFLLYTAASQALTAKPNPEIKQIKSTPQIPAPAIPEKPAEPAKPITTESVGESIGKGATGFVKGVFKGIYKKAVGSE